MHDVGRVLNPIIVEGQIRGGFAHGFGAAMFEELSYDDNGNFLSGSFADYLCPNASDLPHLEFAHYRTGYAYKPFGFERNGGRFVNADAGSYGKCCSRCVGVRTN